MADDSRSGCMLDDPHKSNVLFVRPLAMPCSNPRRQSPLPSARPAPAYSSPLTMHVHSPHSPIHIHTRTCISPPRIIMRICFCLCNHELESCTTMENKGLYGFSHVHLNCMVKNYSDVGSATHHARRAQPRPPIDISVSPRCL